MYTTDDVDLTLAYKPTVTQPYRDVSDRLIEWMQRAVSAARTALSVSLSLSFARRLVLTSRRSASTSADRGVIHCMTNPDATMTGIRENNNASDAMQFVVVNVSTAAATGAATKDIKKPTVSQQLTKPPTTMTAAAALVTQPLAPRPACGRSTHRSRNTRRPRGMSDVLYAVPGRTRRRAGGTTRRRGGGSGRGDGRPDAGI